MIPASELPGIRPAVLFRLATVSITRYPTRSAVIVLVVALAVAMVVGTSGRTEATRRAVLARLEDPSARLIRVIDRTGRAGLAPAAVDRIRGLGAVEWVFALDPPGALAVNAAIGGPLEGYGRDRVGTRVYWGPLPLESVARSATGRMPNVGEAVAGEQAARVLGLADRAGAIADERRGAIAIVGSITFGSPVESLDSYVLIRGAPADGPIGEILVLTRTSRAVDWLLTRLSDLVAVEDPRAIAIIGTEELRGLRTSLAREVGELDVAILFGTLATGALLIGAVMFGAAAERRREFGLRRSQGAARSTIAALMIVEATILSAVGAIGGGAVGSLVVVQQVASLPDPWLTVSVAVLVSLSAVGGSIPAAATAALQEPLYVLRSP